jgi:DNA-binding transcriptional LysR family regulator
MMQLHRLEGFHWVAKTGGYARAARAFPYPITQPAVHQQVKKLEAELGVQLFERVAKDRMQLTPAGRQLHAFAAPFFEGLSAVVRAIQATDYEGEIRIRAADMLLRDLIPAWVKRLRSRCPGAEIHLGELSAPDVSSLLAGEADLLVNHFPEVPASVATKQIATLHGFIVVPRDHRLAKRRRASLTDIQGETIITFTPGILAHHLQVRALTEHGVTLERTITASTAASILGLVEAGLGVSALATLDQEGPRRRGVVAIPVARPRFALPVYAAWRKKGPPHPVLEAALATAPTP